MRPDAETPAPGLQKGPAKAHARTLGPLQLSPLACPSSGSRLTAACLAGAHDSADSAPASLAGWGPMWVGSMLQPQGGGDPALSGWTNENLHEPRAPCVAPPAPCLRTAQVPAPSLFSRETPVTSGGRDHLATESSPGGLQGLVSPRGSSQGPVGRRVPVTHAGPEQRRR